MTWLLVALAVLALLCALCFMAWRNAARERRAALARCSELTSTLNQVLKRLSDVQSAAKIVADNRREADEKVEELHAGDAGGNALDVLSKPPAGGS
ncbi:MAG: hypothetical protein HDR37_04030 [Treponema sp.]|nr:hypothetical protein [Treponema sp.]